MPRPIWSGAISFGLVSIPVKLYNAVSRKSVSFNQLDDRDDAADPLQEGVRRRPATRCPTSTSSRATSSRKGRYVVVEPDELEQFMPVGHARASTSTSSSTWPRSTRSSTTAPTTSRPTRSPKPYALLAQAMEAAGKVAVGRFVMRNKQYVAAMRPVDGRLVLSTMVLRRRGGEPGRHRRARGPRRRRGHGQGADDGRAARRVADRRRSSRSSTTTSTASRCST